MKFSMDKYRFYTVKNKTVAVSTYAGKPVRGVAKCDPIDEFSLEDGKILAAARCNEKIAEKRLSRAKRQFDAAIEQYILAEHRYEQMKSYYEDSEASLACAKNRVSDILDKLS